MAIQWEDVNIQGIQPRFQPVQYNIPLQTVNNTPVSTTPNPYFNRTGMQQTTRPIENAYIEQPIANKQNIDSRVSQFLTNARNNAVGAQYSQTLRRKQGYYDCSSFVAGNLNQMGFNVNPNMTTATMPNDLKKAGFSMIPFNPNDLREGDILWRNGHTEIYSGNGNTIGAHSTKSGVGERSLYGRNGNLITPYTHIFRHSWS